MDGLANGAKLVLVDPRCSETAHKALQYGGRWLAIKPGIDGALALALANVIIGERLYDVNFVAAWTVGFNQIADMVASKTPEWAAPITGISATTIREVAREGGYIMDAGAIMQDDTRVENIRVLTEVTRQHGVYPAGTINARVEARLLRMAELRHDFSSHDKDSEDCEDGGESD